MPDSVVSVDSPHLATTRVTARFPALIEGATSALSWAGSISDRLGRAVDPAILPLVAGLHRFGIETNGSCEGHFDHGHPYPWITISRDDREKIDALFERRLLPASFGVVEGPGADCITLRPLAIRRVEQRARGLRSLLRLRYEHEDWICKWAGRALALRRGRHWRDQVLTSGYRLLVHTDVAQELR